MAEAASHGFERKRGASVWGGNHELTIRCGRLLLGDEKMGTLSPRLAMVMVLTGIMLVVGRRMGWELGVRGLSMGARFAGCRHSRMTDASLIEAMIQGMSFI